MLVPSYSFRFAVVSVLVLSWATVAMAGDLAMSTEPYLEGGLFIQPVFPFEGEAATVTVRPELDGIEPGAAAVRLAVHRPDGSTLMTKSAQLDTRGQATFSVALEQNGLYRVHAVADPEDAVEESDETNNQAELTLPVIVPGKGRALHFPWYREEASARWTTCVTSIGRAEGTRERLAERGVQPLNWEYGGMSWSYYDKERAKADPETELAAIEEVFYKKFTTQADVAGFGIDEIGGYPGSWKLDMSIASMKALARAKAEMPQRFYAVWQGGGIRHELASIVRYGADIYLLETYLWRALPDELGMEDIYQCLVSRVEPFVRGTDMFQPAYGNHCYTLIALDTSERPDRTGIGELENVVRFIRRRWPEMRGIGWYNGGEGSSKYGLEWTEDVRAHHRQVVATADRLCFEYWVKPCVTFLQEALWLDTPGGGGLELVAAVQNIGSIDAAPVTVRFSMDGKVVGTAQTGPVPAGCGRNADMVELRLPVDAAPGPHAFEAKIVEAPGATVLDPVARGDRFVR